MMERWLVSWLRATGPQAPVLLTGDKAVLKDAVEQIKQESDTEVLVIDSQGESIKIAQIREVINALARTALKPRRLVIIEAAEMMGEAAANALLKTLEETAASVRFLLLSSYPRSLPTTILSRCQRLLLRTSGKSNIFQDADAWTEKLEQQLRMFGPSAELRSAWQRWRDYYQIKQLRGNTKLAREVLLAYLPEKQA